MNIMTPNSSFAPRIFRARQDPSEATRYVRAVDLAIDLDIGGMARCNLWRLSSGELFDRNTSIYLVPWLDTIAAGCHIDHQENGNHRIKGLIKAVPVGHVAPRLSVALSIIDTAAQFGDDAVFDADIRLMPENWKDAQGRLRRENTPSKRLFEDFAFEVYVKSNDNPYVGDFHDFHLRDSLEPDGRTYRNLTLRSTACSVELARKYLADHRYF